MWLLKNTKPPVTRKNATHKNQCVFFVMDKNELPTELTCIPSKTGKTKDYQIKHKLEIHFIRSLCVRNEREKHTERACIQRVCVHKFGKRTEYCVLLQKRNGLTKGDRSNGHRLNENTAIGTKREIHAIRVIFYIESSARLHHNNNRMCCSYQLKIRERLFIFFVAAAALHLYQPLSCSRSRSNVCFKQNRQSMFYYLLPLFLDSSPPLPT